MSEKEPTFLEEVITPLSIFFGVLLVLVVSGFLFLHFGLDMSLQDMTDLAKPKPLKNPVLGN